MSDPELEPWDNEFERILGSERARPDESPASQSRVLNRVRDTVALITPPSGGGGPPGAGADGAPPAPSTGGSLVRRLAANVQRSWWALAVGAALGSAGHARLRPAPAPRVEFVTRTVIVQPAVSVTDAAVTNVLVVDAGVGTTAVAADAGVTARHAAPAAASPAHDDLAAERELIDIAREAIAHRRGNAALGPLGRHAATFPRGDLAEERDALWVQALVLAGDHDEARRRAERFDARFPTSMMRSAVHAAIRSIP